MIGTFFTLFYFSFLICFKYGFFLIHNLCPFKKVILVFLYIKNSLLKIYDYFFKRN